LALREGGARSRNEGMVKTGPRTQNTTGTKKEHQNPIQKRENTRCRQLPNPQKEKREHETIAGKGRSRTPWNGQEGGGTLE